MSAQRCLLVLLLLTTCATAADRPNFLFIYTDDQRWDALGIVQREQGDQARFPWLESPHLDRLAAEGVRFRNAFVVTSLCAPSRAAFLTGQYGHRNGVTNNGTPFPTDSVTHASLLRAAGYKTGYFGKWHMGGQTERPGFDTFASFVGQGKYFDCPLIVDGERVPTQGWVDDVTTDYAMKFIDNNQDRPFSMVIGYKTSHGPFTPPPRTENIYAGAEQRPVPNLKSPAIYHEEETREFANRPGNKGTNLGMFRGLRAIDENVGKLLAKLDELGLKEKTFVVYASDNGYYLGEHGLGDKRTAYEESLRIPLIVRYPRLSGTPKLVDRLVLNIDLAPTIVDYAGLPVPKEMQGRSWRTLLEADPAKADWRTSFFYSYLKEGKFGAPTVSAVRTNEAILIRYPGREKWSELFDLKADPYEVHNLYNQTAHADLQSQLEAEFEKQTQAVGFTLPKAAIPPEEGTPPTPKKRPGKKNKPAK